MRESAGLKILLVSSVYPPYVNGGGSVSVKSLADRLAARDDIKVQVLSMADTPSSDIVDGIAVNRIVKRNLYWSYRSLEFSRFTKLAWHVIESGNPAMATVAKLIKTKFAPDLVHFRNIEDFSPSIFYFLAKQNIPSIQTLNSYTMIEPRGTLYRTGEHAQKLLKISELAFRPKRFFSQWCNAVVGVSNFTLQEHLRRGYYRNAEPHVVHTTTPMQQDGQSHKFCAIPERNGAIRFGYLGNFLATKGVGELISTFQKYLNPSAHLFLAGDHTNAYGNQCHNLAKSDPRVHFLGKVRSADLFGLIDVLIVPSIWPEPYPRVLVEANAYSVPVIASASGGTKEGIRHGEDGFVYSNLEDLLKIMNDVGRECTIIQRWQIALSHKVASPALSEEARYVAIYHRVLDKHHSHLQSSK